ncbi:8-amino-7-oxononanoate synthase [Clostridium botulinum D/C]|uniref:8-amino-7-oxononanoate synthase n=1 Tax=Clostridium botulinum TaxID=1491 RepID=UPI001E5D1CB6|nr:8-amino-7-oxononanoate synthase [Clostridium botulinum]MCD3350861.1 8-amino-7-oxononanoate synthase [Clostridium botulinum D/C]MCD3359882.1 8-amino-7-oxononanoate synthase [Clostridium botulinum D/C]MCD3361789.1 8-amino-7-oxononanoate synthase [Clostridium botulinum D/C]MCD3365579.1 8-amino-7-oxononanoate synthase [Clostridium botulinum D/C]
MNLFSIKMRASEEEKHISGAENIVREDELSNYTEKLIKRGLNHPKGQADLLNLKIEKVEKDNILYFEALPVTNVEVDSWQDGLGEVRKFLAELNIFKVEEILELLKSTYAMRGAMLLDVDTLERLEPNLKRGIRATYMDQDRNNYIKNSNDKSHYEEAIVLASKVASAPGVIGEICISDDPDYVTGYVASKKIGYRRITKMKKMGSENGGRIFLYRGKKDDVYKTIEFLERQLVIIKNIQPLEGKFLKHDKFAFIKEELKILKDKNLYRTMKKIQSAQASNIVCDNKKMILMASSNYLDMTNNIQVKEYAKKVLDEYGTGSGGSRLTTGNTIIHEALEKTIAKFKGTENALVFNTGYVTNLSTISSLVDKGDVIFSDELNHASIIDGCRLSGAKIVVYKHNDMNDLEEKIQFNPCAKGIIVSDAVFSMDGDILRLPEFLEIADKYNLISMVDEAHSTGVIGKTGRGIVEYYGLKKKPDILMGTLSKAIGSEGGFVCGSNELIEYLKNKARGFIFSTSLSPVSMAISKKAFEIIEKGSRDVKKLQENIKYFCTQLSLRGINVKSKTPIIPILIGDEKQAMNISKKLLDRGIFISAIRYPTVKNGTARLRATIMSSHIKEELSKVASAIVEAIKEIR